MAAHCFGCSAVSDLFCLRTEAGLRQGTALHFSATLMQLRNQLTPQVHEGSPWLQSRTVYVLVMAQQTLEQALVYSQRTRVGWTAMEDEMTKVTPVTRQGGFEGVVDSCVEASCWLC